MDDHGKHARSLHRSSPVATQKNASPPRVRGATTPSAKGVVGSSLRGTGATNGMMSTGKEDFDLLSDSIPEQLRHSMNLPLGHLNEASGWHCEVGRCSGNPTKPPRDVASARDTVFPVDVGDVMHFARRQDLSLERINAKAPMVYGEILAQNDSMSRDADEEIRCIEELWTLLESTRAEEECAQHEEGDGDGGWEVEAPSGKINDDEVPSRQEFMSHLSQLLYDYEHPEDGAISTTSSSPERGKLMVTPDEVGNGRSTRGIETGRIGNSAASTNGIMSPVTHLPAPLLKLFTAPHYTPILSYVTRVREKMQRYVLQQIIRRAQRITDRLTRAHCHYFNETRDPCYRVAPDYSQWMKEITGIAFSAKGSSSSSSIDSATCGDSSAGFWQQILCGFKPRTNNDTLRELLAEVQHVTCRAESELNSLNRRLEILGELRPLLQRREDILSRQRAIQEGTRERLLSRKVNMAKQLLYEESVRRQCLQELPKVYEQMEVMLNRWNEAIAADEINGRRNNDMRLILNGLDIAALVQEFHEQRRNAAQTRRPVSRSRLQTENNSISQPRSLSPVPLGTADLITPKKASLRTASPTPLASPFPLVDYTPSQREMRRNVGCSPGMRARSQPNSKLLAAKKSISPTPVKGTTTAAQKRLHYGSRVYGIATSRSVSPFPPDNHLQKENRQ
uniref:Uncharacterized protein TCIL3000_9_2100 n=1 Tax=Trypanosoma congolense (strain IL3000) TaxID=1068625 RepID=G0UTU9_TRYCI|nr:unnamed protein product [Trypanosoma congolense IL3000]